MRPGIALADRLAHLTMWLLAAANILFFISFFCAALLAAGRVEAAEPAPCGGKNLLDGLARNDPSLLENIRDEARAVPNGKGLLWKVEKDGAPPSWLFGTMHMTDPRVVELPERADEAFGGSTTLVIETTDILDQSAMTAAMFQHPELTMFTGKTSLTDLLSDEEEETVRTALEKRGVPLDSVKKMKPWMLVSLVALPACEMQRKSAGKPVLDVLLANRAKKDGKAVKGLESVTEQFEAMASLPMEVHVRGLVDTLKLGDKADDVVETMIVLYEKGETGMFWPLFNAVLPSSEGDTSGYAEFEEAIVKARNRTMLKRAKPIIDAGDAFIAVGALHLPGSQGLVALLRDAGYTVTAVD